MPRNESDQNGTISVRMRLRPRFPHVQRRLRWYAGNLIGTLPAYHLNRRWTWGKRGRSRMRTEIVPFWSLSFLGIAFSQLGAWWVKHEVHAHQWSHLVNTALVVGINLFCFAIFWVLKLMVFNKIFHTDPLGDIDEKLTLEEEGVL